MSPPESTGSVPTESEDRPLLSYTRGDLLKAVLVTGGAFLLLAAVVMYAIREKPPGYMFAHGGPIVYQLVVGPGAGLVAALGIGALFLGTRLQNVLWEYQIFVVFSRLELVPRDRVIISGIAGATEEILFRGALQPWLGLWWTSLLFVALHGYIRSVRLAHLAFSLTMFVLSLGLGLLYREVGLVAAMGGHAMYDLVMLQLVAFRGIGPAADERPR